jgi:hypothetical protein
MIWNGSTLLQGEWNCLLLYVANQDLLVLESEAGLGSGSL